MKKKLLYTGLLLLLASLTSNAQRHELGVFGGAANYTGDISRVLKVQNTGPSVGFFYKNNFHSYFNYRLSLNYLRLRGRDSLYDEYRRRNLSFFTPVLELGNSIEYNFEDILTESKSTRKKNASFFVGTGINVIYFDPRTLYNGQVVRLQPLGTEGQIMGGKDKRYSNIVVSVPFTMGIKFRLSDRYFMAIEAGARWCLTDYIDDVSGTYPDLLLMSNVNGAQTAALSDRSTEREGEPASEPGTMRGDSHLKDWYYSLGITFSYRIKDKCGLPNSKFKSIFVD